MPIRLNKVFQSFCKAEYEEKEELKMFILRNGFA